MDCLDRKPRSLINSRNKKWVEFSQNVEFKGMTINNRKALEALAFHYKTGGCNVSFKEVGEYMGCKKATAKANLLKLHKLGIIKMDKVYPMPNCRLPYNFKINIKWSE